jgi:DUF2075 family protein
MQRAYYSSTINGFIEANPDNIIGILASRSEFADEQNQKSAWLSQIEILKKVLTSFDGFVYFEYSIPRMGQRIDVVVIIKSVILILEFKIGKKELDSIDVDQVYDYALDLKNFHEPSHQVCIAPVLIITEAKNVFPVIATTILKDGLLLPIVTNTAKLEEVIKGVIQFSDEPIIDIKKWEEGSYKPTPTIIEAAVALYGGHAVEEISRSDAGAINLRQTSKTVSEIIKIFKANGKKAICFVTGVPGAGKTLVGLNIATTHNNKNDEQYSVFLSGNGPLVAILRESLVRDRLRQEKLKGNRINKGVVFSEVKMFIQNVHNFRDDCIKDSKNPPFEHVAIFDEAQRAWNVEQTTNFMARKKNTPDFNHSEPEFLISCLDRHKDWAVIVCLVGGGQEINTGEAGIGEWIESLNKSYPDWQIYISPKLHDSEYSAGKILEEIRNNKNVFYNEELHLSVSMRSFRAEHVSLLVKQILDLNIGEARKTANFIKEKYPIVITRDFEKAKKWLKEKSRGSERYGMVVSSQAERLKPYAIDVKSPMDPVHWFLDKKNDVRSSFYLEAVATEFDIQGLELDWACVAWDADFKYDGDKWQHRSFRGNKWININKEERKKYQKNAYRVLLTRARQGMVIVVPAGDKEDKTRPPEYYDSTYKYLERIGLDII